MLNYGNTITVTKKLLSKEYLLHVGNVRHFLAGFEVTTDPN